MKYNLIVAVTPAKDEQDNIGRCILSVLGQTYPVKLHVIVDDNSSDKTNEIANGMNDGRVIIIQSGLKQEEKQHGLRPHLVQQIGINKALSSVPDCDFILCLDADCWLPPDYCEYLISRMNKDLKLVMAGAKRLITPTKVETSPDIHVRCSNHVIKRAFYDLCAKYGINYATRHGEILLERFALINGFNSHTFPISAFSSRETGITLRSEFEEGVGEFRLGTPLIWLLLYRLNFLSRRMPKDRLVKICGWLSDKFGENKQYFNKEHLAILRKHYVKMLLRDALKLVAKRLQKFLGTFGHKIEKIEGMEFGIVEYFFRSK